MTEYNIFCYSEKYNDDNSFQQKRYRAFNQEVKKGRYQEILSEVNRILKTDNRMKLSEFWEQVTTKQWKQLLTIPEAKDFKEGFEYISGVEINLEDKVTITCEGKNVEISRESAKALGLVK